jgi:DNA-binding IclR family transcriptional regulator
VAIGDIDGKPFSVAKIAAYMRVPRTTVIRRLDQLQSWGLIDRQGRHYYLHETTLNSANGMRTYQQVRRILSRATKEFSILDTLPDLMTEADTRGGSSLLRAAQADGAAASLRHRPIQR